MAIEIITPVDDDWEQICRADTQAFGFDYTTAEIAELRPLHDLGRFRVAVDDGQIVSMAGSYALDATVPGGVCIPMGGVTWVSTLSTHRRQGIMRQVLNAVHDDIDERGEPLASLYGSEGGIYESRGYGVASNSRTISIDTKRAKFKAEYVPEAGHVRYISGDDVVDTTSEIWERFRRCRAGEVSRSLIEQDLRFAMGDRPEGSLTGARYLRHTDGYAAYRIDSQWNDGQPAHVLHLIQMVAVTPEAHAALWHTVLNVDLVGEVRSRMVAIDDPIGYLLTNQRDVRTVSTRDNIWLNVRDASICFGARTYRTTDRLVVEVDGKRWAIDGSPDEASCRPVRTRADLVTSHAWFSALLYGGVLPSALVAGRRMTARNDDVLRRADLFFPTSLLPHCQTQY